VLVGIVAVIVARVATRAETSSRIIGR